MRIVILIACTALLVMPAFGGEGQLTASKALQAPPMEEGPEGAPLWSFDLNGSYTMGARIMKAGEFGSQAEYHYEIEALRNIHLFKKYYLQIGFDHDQFLFSRSNSALFPYSLTSDAAVIAVSYWSGDEYHALLRLEPGIYYTRNHITKNSFNIPFRLQGGIKVNDQLHLVLGIEVDPFGSSIVFPIAGFNWKVNDQFNIRAVFPKPRISYLPNKSMEFFIGGELLGGAYRNGPTADRRTNNALLDYAEYRACLGMEYDFTKVISLEGNVGWSFERQYNYHRAGPIFNAKGAPYAQLDFKFAF
jgi:Domain of unknown function (DUF6268)